MTVVIDASLLVSLAANDPRAEAVDGMFAGWLASGEAMHAPWTLDGRLVRNASQLGLPVRLVAT